MNSQNRTRTADEVSTSEVINYVSCEFLYRGYANLKMDDIASELHLSKKTIYKNFRTKEELIRIVLVKQLTSAYRQVVTIIQAQSNIVQKFFDLSVMVEMYFSVFNEESIKRLRQDFPELADYIEYFKNGRVIPLIGLLLRIGRKKKLIRNISDEIIIKVFTASLGTIAKTKADYESELLYHKTFRDAFDLLLNGILTKKGKQLLNYKQEVIK